MSTYIGTELVSSIPGLAGAAEAIAAIARGEMIVVVDDENRENEGDLIIAADFAATRIIWVPLSQ